MFTYCNNSPVLLTDASGNVPNDKTQMFHSVREEYGYAVGVAESVMLLGMFATAPLYLKHLDSAFREVYKYAQMFINATISKYADTQPRVHHIVPIGQFKHRSLDIQNKLDSMRNILISVGINPATDPLNLMIVSHGYHKSMHTNWYINTLYHSLSQVSGSPDGVRLVLLQYRIIIAAGDVYASW